MNDIEKVTIIRDLLRRGYIEALKEDGYGKLSEAYMTIQEHYCTFWDYREGKDFFNPESYLVTIYSYMLGPSRTHEFEGKTLSEALDKALDAVKEWVKCYGVGVV